MITLNSFLRNLPELVVDNLRFERSEAASRYSDYYIDAGVWKLRKTGYNYYDVSVLTSSGFSSVNSWDSSESAGDLILLGIRVSLTGVIVILGGDAPETYEEEG